jgi:hypothetical protein
MSLIKQEAVATPSEDSTSHTVDQKHITVAPKYKKIDDVYKPLKVYQQNVKEKADSTNNP